MTNALMLGIKLAIKLTLEEPGYSTATLITMKSYDENTRKARIDCPAMYGPRTLESRLEDDSSPLLHFQDLCCVVVASQAIDW